MLPALESRFAKHFRRRVGSPAWRSRNPWPQRSRIAGRLVVPSLHGARGQQGLPSVNHLCRRDWSDRGRPRLTHLAPDAGKQRECEEKEGRHGRHHENDRALRSQRRAAFRVRGLGRGRWGHHPPPRRFRAMTVVRAQASSLFVKLIHMHPPTPSVKAAHFCQSRDRTTSSQVTPLQGSHRAAHHHG
jgi:hypothetical protein